MDVRCTLIPAANIWGFISLAYHTVQRDEVSDERVAGTVDGDYFLYYVTDYLVPMLGNYQCGEPRSVVMMDNTLTHISDEIQAVIEDVSAVLIYGALLSPHLNPIENYFSIYKKKIKRNGDRMQNDWRAVYLEALNEVDEVTGANYFRSCGISGL